ncbi:cation:proton antiporter [Vallitalea okinawensis]|uniref:cation:proton antiporter n=1 Tax=Vallitalea okinawensis TaxID=2078660 RepID=UPI000CFD61FA|nr:cation:proton antiporter [Vallitalea okinawensis]
MEVFHALGVAEDNIFLLEISVLLLAAFIGGKLTAKLNMPEVLGQILMGIIIGPTVLGLIDGETEFISSMAEVGVLLLMFLAGLETNLKELKASGKGASFVALGGMLLPLLLGTLIPFMFFKNYLPNGTNDQQFMYALYIGTILTATSVSIAVSVLRDMGQIASKQGISILGGAIIDDVLGIILLAVVTGIIDPSGSDSVGKLIFRMIIFFVVAIVAGTIISKVINRYASHYAWSDKFIPIAIIICFLFAFSSEVFKVAAITGAYIAGVIFSTTPFRHKIERRIQYIGFSLFTPIFFVSIGLKANITSEVFGYIGYAMIIVLIAIIGKIVGCGLGARATGFTTKQSLQIGVGMIARAEVALIVATEGITRGIITDQTFTSIVLLVVISTIVTPPLLKMLFSKEKPVCEIGNQHNISG